MLPNYCVSLLEHRNHPRFHSAKYYGKQTNLTNLDVGYDLSISIGF